MRPFEDIRGYRPGGYHPVHLGDKFNDRYLVEHKLGFGGFSTVWLARDLRQERFVALKILMAAASSGERSSDSPFLRRLCPQSEPRWGWLWSVLTFGQKAKSSSGPSFFPTLRDEFIIHGPNGDHLCMVTEVLGPSLSSLLSIAKDYRLPLEVAREVAVQLAQGVAELHDRGIVHGDLHQGNVLFQIPAIESWTTIEQVYTYLGEPKRLSLSDVRPGEPLAPSPHLPQYFVCSPPSAELMLLCLEVVTIRIIDFGEAFFCAGSEGVHKTLGTPPAFAAPEVLFQDVLTPACDIWALGCLIFSIIGDHYLWEDFEGKEDVLIDLTITFGKLPDRWWKLWKNRPLYFEEDGQLKSEHVGEIETDNADLKTRITKGLVVVEGSTPGMEDDEMAAFERLMLATLKLEPEERIAVKDVVRLLPASWTAR